MNSKLLRRLKRAAALALAATVLSPALVFVTAPPATAETLLAVCRISAENPHHSGHFTGTINSIGHLEFCKGDRIPDLHLDVRLLRWKDGGWRVVKTVKKVLRPGTDLIRISRSTHVCVSAWYATSVRIYGLGEHHPWRRGNSVYIECNAAGGGGGGGGGGGW